MNRKWFSTFLRIAIGASLCLLSAPESAMAANSGDVVITEIMYNAASSESTTKTQYIEIFNNSGASIDLSNWTIDDEDADGPNTIPSGTTITAGELLVIVGSSQADFTGAWGTPASQMISLLDDGQIMFNLSNSPSGTSEIIQLRDNSSNLIDEVNYDDASSWPSNDGASSIYLNVQVDVTSNDDGANWRLSTPGTGGAITASASGVWDSGADVGSPGGGYTPTALTLTSLTATIPRDTWLPAVLLVGAVTILGGAAFALRKRRNTRIGEM